MDESGMITNISFIYHPFIQLYIVWGTDAAPLNKLHTTILASGLQQNILFVQWTPYYLKYKINVDLYYSNVNTSEFNAHYNSDFNFISQLMN
jgi:hypothetical protein